MEAPPRLRREEVRCGNYPSQAALELPPSHINPTPTMPRSQTPENNRVPHDTHAPSPSKYTLHDRKRRSRSPRRDEDRHRHKRHRSRSPEAKPVKLPYKAKPLSKRQYEEYEPLFQSYLDIQKNIQLDELDEREAKGRWKSFISRWYA